MKKVFPYVIGGLVLLFLVSMIVASKAKPVRRMDERITLRQRDKIPYGTAVAKHLLPSLFPQATIYFDTRYPGSWDDIGSHEPNQAVILMADYLDADSDELNRLSRFVSKGNDVFIIARSFSDEAADYFKLTFNTYYNYYSTSLEDSLRIRLEKSFFSADSFFTYPGKRYEGSLQKFDSARTQVLGHNEGGWVNFVRLKKGSGNFYIHTAPLAFSNYFILHKQNATYYRDVFSVFPASTKAVLWNEYYLEKLQNPNDDKDVNWLGALFKNPSFRWGFLTALFTLLLFLLLGMRRRQRMIPLYEKPKNDSLDFVKTLGRLYYDKRDHKNLAEKMGTYFLEHVRSKYKIATHTLDDEWVKALHVKSGYPETEIQKIVNDIEQFREGPDMSEEQLAEFHKSLELFYQNT
jgi:hypothetical protein